MQILEQKCWCNEETVAFTLKHDAHSLTQELRNEAPWPEKALPTELQICFCFLHYMALVYFLIFIVSSQDYSFCSTKTETIHSCQLNWTLFLPYFISFDSIPTPTNYNQHPTHAALLLHTWSPLQSLSHTIHILLKKMSMSIQQTKIQSA